MHPPRLSTFRDKLAFIALILAKHKSLLIPYAIFSILISLIYAILPYFVKLQIDQLEQQSTTFAAITANPLLIFFVLLAIPFVLEFINSRVLNHFASVFSVQLSARLKSATERFIWDKLGTLDAGFFQSKRTQKMFKDALRCSSIIDRAFQFFSRRVISSISFLAILPLMALVSWELLILITVVAILQFLVTKSLHYRSEGYSLAESRTSEDLWRIQSLLEHNYYELKMMGNIDELVDRYQVLRVKVDQLQIRRENANIKPQSISWLLDNGLLLIANLFVGYQVLTGTVSIGTFMLVVAYTQQISHFFQTLLDSMSEWQDIDFDLAKLDFLFALKSRIKSSKHPQPLPTSVTTAELCNVNFQYPDHGEDEKKYLRFLIKRLNAWMVKEGSSHYEGEIEEIERLLAEEYKPTQVLKNTSLKIERGKIIALVGRNGSGKTTSTHLLQHHYEPNSGEVLLDGIALPELDQNEVLKQFSWLTQNPLIMERQSLRENLFLGSPKTAAVEHRAEQVLHDLKLDALINALPKKLETIVDEDTSFSGGQRQLLAVARCLIQQRPFLIFDEGSSQLDVENEFLVLQQLQKAKEHTGILFITHRMSVARKADYIYVIDDGKIVQEGTHHQMLTEPTSLYAQFWEMQTVG